MMIILYNMIMNYFNNIEWNGFNHIAACEANVNKYFTDYFVIDYNHHGELALQLDDGPIIQLKSPVVWFTFPGPFFSFKPIAGTTWDHRHIGFRGERISLWLETGLLKFDPNCPIIPIINPERFVKSMDEIINYLSSPNYGQARAVQLFEGLLLQLHEQQGMQAAVSVTDNKVATLMAKIDLKPELKWDFKQQAKQLGMSYSHFRLIFRNLSGIPPHQYLLQRRLEKGAVLLRENRLAIKEVAQTVGYEDIFHFSKLFKQHFQIPPARFRNQSNFR